MKFIVFFLFAACLEVSATGYSQKVSLSQNDVSLKKVFKEIEKQSGYNFFYKDKLMRQAKDVSIHVNNVSVEEALNVCFQNQPLSYTIVDKIIVVKEKKVSAILKPEIETAIPLNIITGSVKDESGKPLAGVSVMIIGTQKGTTTNTDGSFSIDANKGDVLEFSIVGYKKKSVTLESGTTINIQMEIEVTAGSEIVVVGYGAIKEKHVTGAVSKVKGSDLVEGTSSNFTQSLQGMTPGLQVNQSTGQPGANVQVQIRTNPSNASSGVLYVIDGVPINDAPADPGTSTKYGTSGVDASPLNFINPNDIESIEFLKDASAASIYGARAGAGVILITTKHGKTGKPTITYNANCAFQSPSKLYNLLNTKDYMTTYNEALQEIWLQKNNVAPFYGNVDGSTLPPYTPKFTQQQIDTTRSQESAMDVITRKGLTEQHNLSLSGGNGKTSYYVSGNYFKQKGVVIASDYTRYNGRINLNQIVSDHIKVGVNVVSSNSNANNSNTGGQYENGGIFTAALYYPPTMPFMDANGNYPLNPQYGAIPNPLSYETVSDLTTNKRLLTNGYAEWEIIPGLLAKGNFSYDQATTKRSAYEPKTFLYGTQAGGIASIGENSSNVGLMEYTLNYSHVFSQKHALQLLGGYSYQVTNYDGFNAGNSNFFTDAFIYNSLQTGQAATPPVGSYKTQITWASYFGRAIYTYNDKYTLTAVVRNDGSSVFAKNKKFGTFPSVSAGWNISEENFMKNINAINFLKLRAGYGTTGNSNIQGSAFSFYGPHYGSNYVFGNTVSTGVPLLQLNNDNLTWETDAEINAGVDFGLFQNRISGSFDYYSRTISNLLAQVPLASDFLVSSVWENSGKTRAKGWELGIQSRNVVSTNNGFQWNTSLNLSHYISYWVERSPDALKVLPKYISASGKNAPFNGIYGYVADGIYKGEAGKIPTAMPGMLPGGIILKDIHGYDANGNLTGPDGSITAADQTLIGNTDPKYIFGLTNSFKYKNFDLLIYFYGSKQQKYNIYQGLYTANLQGTMVSYGWNDLSKVKERWSSINPSGNFPTGVTDNTYSNFQNASSYYLSDASFIRCKDITLGYTFPSSLIKKQNVLSGLRLYLSAQNAFVITKFPEVDPELALGNYYPMVSSFVIGLNAKF